MLVLPCLSQAAEYTVTGDWRMIEDYFLPLPPGAEEGAIRVTVTADRPIDLVGADPAFVREDAFTFTTVFPWNWTEPRTPGFSDDLGDTTYILVAPQTPRPFNPGAHDIPVVSITTDRAGLWDAGTGIYVVGNYINFDQRGGAWEREATFQYFEPGIGLVVDEPVGLRIHGGFSRYYHQKGLRIYFDDYGLADQIEHPFFPTGPTTFRRLICRANRFDSVAVNTNIAEGLMGDLGHAYSRHRFIAVYLNEEYWGAYNLRERLDDEFFEHNWSLAQKGDWNFIKDGDEEEGSAAGWWTFLASFGDVTNPADPAWFDEVRRTMDLASYIDWQLINFFLVPGDNGFTWNLALYQPGDHPWRFVMWDEDLIMHPDDIAADMFSFFTADGPDEWAARQAPSDVRPWTPEQQEWLTMFRTLLGNPDFRSLFRSRYEYLITQVLTPEALIARLDALATEQGPEIPGQADRWEGFQVDWYEANVERTRQWIIDRHPYFLTHADRFFAEWPAPEWPGTYQGLVINEIMPLNESTITDESGDFDAWVELYNSGPLPINLTGVQMFTDLTWPQLWVMPAVMIRPGEHLLVWLDGQQAEGPLHTPLTMQPRGNTIRLSAPVAAGSWPIDGGQYGDVMADHSVGRSRDGAFEWVSLAEPTPGGPNSGPIIHPGPVPSAVVLQDNYPNPFNSETNIIFGLPTGQNVRISVFDARGRFITTLIDGHRDEGFHPVKWDGTDNAGRAVASGVYYARLESGGGNLTNTMTLIR
ncbi:MAG: CotH kinase family protein [Candidatus Krumholzibacteriota bacterium]